MTVIKHTWLERGSASLEMICCNAKMVDEAANTGSTQECVSKEEESGTFPLILTLKMLVAAIAGPEIVDMCPVGKSV